MDVLVIGGGASGMMAAITSARLGNSVTIVEKTSSLGNKIKITGKGRCNITFDGDIESLKKNVVHNYRFMYSSFSKFNNTDVVDFFEKLGVKTKIERGGRIFPISDSAIDVVRALEREIKKLGIKVIYNDSLKKLLTNENTLYGVLLESGKVINCDKCIIATGGKSYKTTGSTGDGYKALEEAGHKIVMLKPGLIPMRSSDAICQNLQGLTLKNVKLKIKVQDKICFEDFGEMLFAHFGITGPIVLSASSIVNRIENIEEKMKEGKVFALIDLKPALDMETLSKRVQKDFEKYSNKEFKNSLNDLLPKKMIPEIINLSGIDPDKKVHQITKNERNKLTGLLKEIKIKLDKFMGLDMAIITCGGVCTNEINPKTMESKIIKNLFICGEILDVDALTGGYNLQIAFSTGYAAGQN